MTHFYPPITTRKSSIKATAVGFFTVVISLKTSIALHDCDAKIVHANEMMKIFPIQSPRIIPPFFISSFASYFVKTPKDTVKLPTLPKATSDTSEDMACRMGTPHYGNMLWIKCSKTNALETR